MRFRKSVTYEQESAKRLHGLFGILANAATHKIGIFCAWGAFLTLSNASK